MAGQSVPQGEQEEAPHGPDGKEAFGVTQTKVQSQLHHCQLRESRHVSSTLAVLPTSMYESIDRKRLPSVAMGTQRKPAKKYHSRDNLNLQSNVWEMLPFLLIPCSRRREVEYTNPFTVLTPWIRNTKTGCFNYPRHTVSCTKCLAGSPFYFQF